jgi:hypothetical protein
MPDYVGAPSPSFLHAPRFQLLSTLAWRQAQSSGKTADITQCFRFNIFGCTGAFSAPHCDILSGTWVTCLFGLKLWMWVDPAEMDDADWTEYKTAGDDWVPTRVPIYGVVIRPGFTFVMPPGLLIIHAVHTLRESAMAGGMYWDEASLCASLQCCTVLLDHPDLSNEPMVLDLGASMDHLVSLVKESRPHLNTSEFHAAVAEVKGRRCYCVSSCHKEKCACAKAGRRCNWLCTAHKEGRVRRRLCLYDQWHLEN